MSSAKFESEVFDPARRRLCPDGSCVGLLDDTGRCKVCGLTASGETVAAPAAPALHEMAEPHDTEELDEADLGAPEAPTETASAAGASAFDPKRRLCPDGSCVGIIGENGRCKVCGREG
jgi:hypothetical protein